VARRERQLDPQLILRFGRRQCRTGQFPGRRTRKGADRYQATRRRNFPGDIIMGKYLVGWLLGVPVFVLVILYFFFH
jgi:hypothetical protein